MTENNTDVRELVEVEFQLDIPKGPRVRASPPEDGGEAGGEVETSTSYSGSGSTVTPVGEATTDTITTGSDPTTSSGSQLSGGLSSFLLLAACLGLTMMGLHMSQCRDNCETHSVAISTLPRFNLIHNHVRFDSPTRQS